MTEIRNAQADIDDASTDVFAAARWLDSQWNSSAKAVSANEIQWQCNTWGSARGQGDWIETARFLVAAAAFGLAVSRNWEGRDELIVTVPFDHFAQIAGLLNRLGEEPEAWPWCAELVEDDVDRQVAIAADELALSPSAVAGNSDLLEALRIQ